MLRPHKSAERNSHPAVVAVVLMTSLVMSSCAGLNQDAPQITVPAGTELIVSISEPLSTATNQPGETFLATAARDLRVGDTVAVPAGSRIRGTLSKVEAPGRTKGRAKMTLVFEEVSIDDENWQSIDTRPIVLEAPSETEADLEKVAAGGVAGAVIGAIAGGRKGAAIGGIIGASAGGAVVLSTKGDQIELPSGQQFAVTLKGPVTVPVATRG